MSNHLTQVVQPKLSSSPLQERKIHTMERKVQIAFTILMMCQATNMDIEPCANSMWTEGVIRDCYTGHAEKCEGLAQLSLWATLEKPYVLVSYCQCQPSESEQVELWRNLTARLLPSLAILDQSVRTLTIQYEEIKALLKHEKEDKRDATLRQSKTNHCWINKLHKRIS